MVHSQELKERLQPACFDQKQITTSSEIVVLLGKKGLYEPGSKHVAEMFKRWNYPEDMYKFMLDFHALYAKDCDLTRWSVEQCHIAAANMMTAAAMIGIDSCPIGGFIPEKVKEALNLDGEKYEVAMIIPFGYRVQPQPPKNRLSFDEVVEFR